MESDYSLWDTGQPSDRTVFSYVEPGLDNMDAIPSGSYIGQSVAADNGWQAFQAPENALLFVDPDAQAQGH